MNSTPSSHAREISSQVACRRGSNRWMVACGVAVAMCLGAGRVSASPIYSLTFIATTGTGVTGGDFIEAAIGDVLTLQMDLTAGPTHVAAYSASLAYGVGEDSPTDEVWTTGTPNSPPFNITIHSGTLNAEADQMLGVSETGFGVLIEGNTITLGTLIFTVGASGSASTDDTGLLNPGDGIRDGFGQVLFSSVQAEARWAIPEPSPALLVSLGMVGLAAVARRNLGRRTMDRSS